MIESAPVVDARALTRIFRTGEHEVRALDSVDLTVGAGEMLAIVGSSGSGKSTLMYILGCLDRPSAGQYYLNGENVATLDDERLSRIRNEHIGFIFQSYHLISQLDVIENIEVPLFYHGLPRARRREISAELARLVGLADRVHHRPNELSGGQMQRVAIARALANEPLLLLADEPTGNIDSRSGEEILSLFERLHAMGKTVVMVTHNAQIAQRAQRTLHLKDGKVVPNSDAV